MHVAVANVFYQDCTTLVLHVRWYELSTVRNVNNRNWYCLIVYKIAVHRYLVKVSTLHIPNKLIRHSDKCCTGLLAGFFFAQDRKFQ